MDIRVVYICATIDLKKHVLLCDTLNDAKFLISKIEEDEFFEAFENCRWVYTLNDETYDRFITFIKTNYDKTIEIMDAPITKLLE